MHRHILQQFDEFAKSLRYAASPFSPSPHALPPAPSCSCTEPTVTEAIYKKMKFIPKKTDFSTTRYSGIHILENYIYNTKDVLDKRLNEACIPHKDNLTINQRKAITKFQRQRSNITIKPADKNLGLDTDDYLSQCITILMDPITYRLTTSYPLQEIKEAIGSICAKFSNDIRQTNKHLYEFLLPKKNKSETPKFYGIPKVHKKFEHIPPMRPIIAQTNSPLAPSAKFIDHVLQPLAQSYPDFLHDSTSLIKTLENMTLPRNSILVTIDVTNLYPSIPQTECLQIIYNEMFQRRHLLLVDPNLIIQLLQINVNFNYFSFAGLSFQQTHGTAMGAAFSPTIANIFMSVTLNKFLRTQQTKPVLLSRYVDDIFLIRPNKENVQSFLSELNNFHPNIKFTHTVSESTVDFLDLTVYNGPQFSVTQKLDIKTFQKPHNLYQYLEYTSAHPKNIFKSIIVGECKRYLRSNTRPETYAAIVACFKKRLQERLYPSELIGKITSKIKFTDRKSLLRTPEHRHHQAPRKPVFKFLPPPQFNYLKTVVLQLYQSISKIVTKPRFITLAYPPLRKMLVKAEIRPTPEQLFDILVTLQDTPNNSSHATSGRLPQLKDQKLAIHPCRMYKCSTCSHLNCSSFFTSTVTKRSFPIRFSATCSSSYIIYLITCTKCKKQYVGLTTTQLKTRINHHRSNIFCKKTIYLCRHFNFSDHSVHNLSVQVIDKAYTKTLQELQKLERYWIKTLNTLQPRGLNCSPGT